jgi:hypothetical protein
VGLRREISRRKSGFFLKNHYYKPDIKESSRRGNSGMISQTVSAIDRFKNESFEIYTIYFLYPNFLKLFVFPKWPNNFINDII